MYGNQQPQSNDNTMTIVLIVCILWCCSILFSCVFCSTSIMTGVNKKKSSLSNIFNKMNPDDLKDIFKQAADEAVKNAHDADSKLATAISS